MNNNGRNVHGSGPLSLLIKQGQIKKVDDSNPNLPASFQTESGITFSEGELLFIPPYECEPWKYANRHEDEMGFIKELEKSIKEQGQLQPVLIRKHPNPHDGVKYEIIFGRRRHIACKNLNRPMLAILKNIANIQEAIAFQDAENKWRKDISNYSNALLYRKLIDDHVFKSEKELAKKLDIPTSSFNEIMAFSKLPADIVKRIPNVHNLSKNFAVTICAILNEDENIYQEIYNIAPKIGLTIKSPAILKKYLKRNENHKNSIENSVVYKAENGTKLFTLKTDQRGMPNLVINKKIAPVIDIENLCEVITNAIKKQMQKSGYPD